MWKGRRRNSLLSKSAVSRRSGESARRWSGWTQHDRNCCRDWTGSDSQYDPKEDWTWILYEWGRLIICQMKRRRRALTLGTRSFLADLIFCWTHSLRSVILGIITTSWRHLPNWWALLPIPLYKCDTYNIWHYRHLIPKYVLNKLWNVTLFQMISNFPQMEIKTSARAGLFTLLFPERVNAPEECFSPLDNSRECRHRSTARHLILTLGAWWPWPRDTKGGEFWLQMPFFILSSCVIIVQLLCF